MEITVNKSGMLYLRNLLHNPSAMGTHFLGERFQQYKTKDLTGAQQVLSLQRWITKEFKDLKEADINAEGWMRILKLKKVYVDRLIEMLDHYKELGNVPAVMEYYWSLHDSLEGKDIEARIDDPTGD